MLDYLGFPDTQDDVDKLMNKVDWVFLHCMQYFTSLSS